MSGDVKNGTLNDCQGRNSYPLEGDPEDEEHWGCHREVAIPKAPIVKMKEIRL